MAVIPNKVEGFSNEDRWSMWLEVTFAALAAGYVCVAKVLKRHRKARGTQLSLLILAGRPKLH